jgi:hypothetical protein
VITVGLRVFEASVDVTDRFTIERHRGGWKLTAVRAVIATALFLDGRPLHVLDGDRYLRAGDHLEVPRA